MVGAVIAFPLSAMSVAIIMGVAGAGKSTIGEALAQVWGATFADADDFHPSANVAKMAAGNPLSHDDRWPWLDALNAHLLSQPQDARLVLACSALKDVYRERLTRGLAEVTWLWLDGSAELLAERLRGRANHFMSVEMLQSQLDTLETPAEAVRLDISESVEEIVKAARGALPGG